MRENTKRFLLNIFGSLISNRYLLDGARTAPFYVAVIMFLIGNFLPIIPTMVQIGNSKGSDFLKSNTYGVEIALAEQTHTISESYTFKVDDENKLLIYDESQQTITRSETEEESPLVPQYVNQNTNQIDLQVYYLNRIEQSKDSSIKTIKTFVKVLEETTYKVGTAEPYTLESIDDETKVYKPSYIVIYPTGILMALYRDGSTTMASASPGGLDWKKFEKDTDLIGVLSAVKDESDANVEYNLRNQEYTDGVFNNWKSLFDTSYENRKVVNFWATSGIYYGIYLSLTIVMGLLVFLLTRGKKNPYNYMSFLTCEAIEGWVVVSPGIIGMVIGFIAPNYAVMSFIMLVGLRTMWLSMKQLRPQYN